jgi:predicted phosphate transport protein (TIGR00153 family)
VGIKDFFKPRQDNFLRLLIEHAAKTLEGLEGLEEFVQEPSDELAHKVRMLEKEADEVRRILIDELNRTFVTPIDREDIFSLSRAIDDVIDYANTTVEEMVILKVMPNSFLPRMVSLLREAAYEIHQAMLRLKDHPNVASDHAIRAKALENRVEHVYREAIADLFSGPEDIHHVMDMLKLREIYRHLSNCADRGDEAANVITDIVIKMA